MKRILIVSTRVKGHFIRYLTLILLIVPVINPDLTYAGCTLSWSCGGGSAYSGSKPFSDKASCERERSKALSTGHYQSGGGCSLGSCTCTGGSASSAGQGLGPADQLMLDLSYQLGVEIGKSLFGGPKDSAAEEAERLMREEQTRMEVEELNRREEEKKARFNLQKEELLNEFKGGASAEDLGWKDASGYDLAFKAYHERETERRNVLDKTLDVWCKLSPPLEPVCPLKSIPDDQYDRMRAYYIARKAEFDRRCREMEQASANTLLEPWKETSLPQGNKMYMPVSCSVCWSNFDREARACDPSDILCVNGSLDRWTLCQGECRAEPCWSAVRSVSSYISEKKDKNDPCPNHLAAFTYACGGGSEWPYVCCPKEAPYLNHCDCGCYNSSDFECQSYSRCRERIERVGNVTETNK